MTETTEARERLADERDLFEAWYVADAPMPFTQESIKALREGDHYGAHRHALNGKWEGWQARALLSPAPAAAPVPPGVDRKTVQYWRDDAFEAAAQIVERYVAGNPHTGQTFGGCPADIRAMKSRLTSASVASPVADGAGEGKLREAAADLIATATDTYKARNGRTMGIEADDGEKCWIVHSDQIEALRLALSPKPTGEG